MKKLHYALALAAVAVGLSVTAKDLPDLGKAIPTEKTTSLGQAKELSLKSRNDSKRVLSLPASHAAKSQSAVEVKGKATDQTKSAAAQRRASKTRELKLSSSAPRAKMAAAADYTLTRGTSLTSQAKGIAMGAKRAKAPARAAAQTDSLTIFDIANPGDWTGDADGYSCSVTVDGYEFTLSTNKADSSTDLLSPTANTYSWRVYKGSTVTIESKDVDMESIVITFDDYKSGSSTYNAEMALSYGWSGWLNGYIYTLTSDGARDITLTADQKQVRIKKIVVVGSTAGTPDEPVDPDPEPDPEPTIPGGPAEWSDIATFFQMYYVNGLQNDPQGWQTNSVEIIRGETENDVVIYGLFYELPVYGTVNLAEGTISVPAQTLDLQVDLSDTQTVNLYLAPARWNEAGDDINATGTPLIFHYLPQGIQDSEGNYVYVGGLYADSDQVIAITAEEFISGDDIQGFFAARYGSRAQTFDSYGQAKYGLPAFSFNESEWTKCSTRATFSDGWIAPAFGQEIVYEVDVYVNNVNKNEVLLANPYGPESPYVDVNSWTLPGYILLDVADPNLVIAKPFVPAGMAFDYGGQYLCENLEGAMRYIYGYTDTQIKDYFTQNNVAISTLKDGVVSIPNCRLAMNYNMESSMTWVDADGNALDMQALILLPDEALAGAGSDPENPDDPEIPGGPVEWSDLTGYYQLDYVDAFENEWLSNSMQIVRENENDVLIYGIFGQYPVRGTANLENGTISIPEQSLGIAGEVDGEEVEIYLLTYRWNETGDGIEKSDGPATLYYLPEGAMDSEGDVYYVKGLMADFDDFVLFSNPALVADGSLSGWGGYYGYGAEPFNTWSETQYGISIFEFNESEWTKSAEPASFTDGWFALLFDSVEPYDVDLYINNADKNKLLLANPYTQSPYSDFNTWTEPGYIMLDITDPEVVMVRPFVPSGWAFNYQSQFFCFNLEGSTHDLGHYTLDEIKQMFADNQLETSTLDSNGVVTVRNGRFSRVNNLATALYYAGDDNLPAVGRIVLPKSAFSGGVTPDDPVDPDKKDLVEVIISTENGPGSSVKVAKGTQMTLSYDLDAYWTLSELYLNGEDQSSMVSGNRYTTPALNDKTNIKCVIKYAGELEVVTEDSGVEDLGGSGVSVRVKDGAVVIEGLSEGDQVAVYNLGGQTVMNRKADGDYMSITLSTGAAYIVRVNSNAVKVVL